MKDVRFFLLGAVVGAVLVAAWGFDLFPPRPKSTATRNVGAPQESVFSGSSSVTLSGAIMPANSSGSDTNEAVAELNELEAELEQRIAEVRLLRGRGLETETSRRRLEEEYDALSDVLAAERQRSARLQKDIGSVHQQRFASLERFFGSKRDPSDAILVEAFLASGAPEALKSRLVELLLNKNIDIVSAVAPTRATHDPENRGTDIELIPIVQPAVPPEAVRAEHDSDDG